MFLCSGFVVALFKVPNHEFAFSSVRLLVHVFVLPAFVCVVKCDYLLSRVLVFGLLLWYLHTLSVGPPSLVFSKNRKSPWPTLHNTVEQNRNYQALLVSD